MKSVGSQPSSADSIAEMGKRLARALEHIHEARFALVDASWARGRGRVKQANHFERKARRHLQAAKRLIERADKIS